MNRRALTEEEFNGWWAQDATKELIRILHKKREELRQLWEGGSFGAYSKDETVLMNVGNLGTCRGFAFITDLTYENYVMELTDD